MNHPQTLSLLDSPSNSKTLCSKIKQIKVKNPNTPLQNPTKMKHASRDPNARKENNSNGSRDPVRTSDWTRVWRQTTRSSTGLSSSQQWTATGALPRRPSPSSSSTAWPSSSSPEKQVEKKGGGHFFVLLFTSSKASAYLHDAIPRI